MADRDPADPLAGLRAMAEVQRAGIDAAREVVERMLELGRLGTRAAYPFPIPASPPAGSNGDDPEEPEEPGRELRRLRADAERMLELWGDWMRLLLDAAADSAEATASSHPRAAERLALGPAAPGEAVTRSAWLHVLDGPPAAPARLRATPLAAHDGSVIAGSAVSFDPPLVDSFALRSSEEIAVSVAIPADAAPGIYHGHILAAGLPELGLAVRLDVTS